MFAEWVAGMRPPDPNTINKHVHDMVEVRRMLVYQLTFSILNLTFKMPSKIVADDILNFGIVFLRK